MSKEEKYILGIGCRRGVSSGDIERAVLDVLNRFSIDRELITSIASVDIKSDEEGLLLFAKLWHLDISFFSLEALKAIEVPNPSDRVVEKIGIPGVCEAAALKALHLIDVYDAALVVEKQKYGNVTVAVASNR